MDEIIEYFIYIFFFYFKQIGSFVSNTNITLIENSYDAAGVDSLCKIKSYLDSHEKTDTDKKSYVWAIVASVITVVLLCLIIVLLWWRKKSK